MDDIFKKHGLLISSLISLALGALIFILFFGYRIINPFYVDWIFYSPYDLIETYIGWTYFCHSPWHFPLGMYDSLSYPIQTTILNTDSIPLFAIFFKLFKNILPIDFQYWGLYVLLCYMLQSFFGMLIIRKFTKNDLYGNIIAILSGVLFCLVPSMTIKVFWHTTSVYHFLLLAVFVPVIYKDKFSLKRSIIYYAILGFLCGSTQPYILVIDAIILLAYSIYKWSDKKEYRHFLPFASYCFTALFILYLIGAFAGSYQFNSATDLNINSFNLNGFFNSQGEMRFFSEFKVINDSQSQGYAYYGIGILIIMAICICHIVKRFISDNIKPDFKKYRKELILICSLIVISVVLAASPQVSFSDIVLFEIPLPQFVFDFWTIFRCTGRFIWIATYIILIIAMIYFVKHVDKKKCIAILLCCIALQLWDFENMVEPKAYLKDRLKFKNVFDNDRWNNMYKNNTIKNIYWDKLICDKAEIIPFTTDTENLTGWARDKNIKFNCFYFARKLKGYEKYYFEKLKNPNDEDIFIFIKNDLALNEMLSQSLKHYYLYDPFIVARNSEITGWEDIEVKRENLESVLEKAVETSAIKDCPECRNAINPELFNE